MRVLPVAHICWQQGYLLRPRFGRMTVHPCSYGVICKQIPAGHDGMQAINNQ